RRVRCDLRLIPIAYRNDMDRPLLYHRACLLACDTKPVSMVLALDSSARGIRNGSAPRRLRVSDLVRCDATLSPRRRRCAFGTRHNRTRSLRGPRLSPVVEPCYNQPLVITQHLFSSSRALRELQNGLSSGRGAYACHETI